MKKHLFLFILMLSPMLASAVDVKIDETTFPDSNFRNWVLSQEYGADGVLTNEELENVTSLEINRLEIHDLKGIEYFIALKVLNCMTNKLTALDLSKNIALEKLECVGNRLTTINLLENSKLRLLSCVSNQLTTLDVSGCTELDTLACSGNQLTALNVSMNTKLISLECYGNQLSALNLSRNTALRRIHCNANKLTSLDVSKNTALTMLQCSSNLLTTLDVTKNSAITSLSCTDNKLITLYMSNNKSLESITCFRNQLTSLDASGCSALKTLNCTDNQLTTLDLSGCSVLEEVYCNDNQLSTLDLSENTALTRLSCYHNQIKGAGMDALVENLPTVNGGSLNVVYFENEQNVMTTTQVAAAKAKGWTPYLCTYNHPKEYAGQEVSPYGEWWLVGWNDGGIYFEVDTNYVSHRHLSIEIPIEGSVMAFSMANDLFLGQLTLNGNEMIFGGEKFMTQVGVISTENQFFEDHIWDIKSYQLEGKLLKLYYTDNDYFVFTSDFDNSEEHLYEWKNGPADPYIGEVTAMNDAEVEVKVINIPSYTSLYSRTMPPTSKNETCHFVRSDLADQSFEVGDKIAFRIVQFKRLKVEEGREYQLKVESCKGSKTVTDRTGTIHNDRRMGWIIIDDEVIDGKTNVYYYPLKNLAKEYLTEGQRVRFSGELYPTILPPWDGISPWDCYYLSIDTFASYEPEGDYRPFVEEGKVWKVGNTQAILDNSVQVVDYYYFDGDTIIGGKTCKQMMCQRFVSPGFSDEYGYWTPKPFLKKVGAWYEEDQKVYFYDEITQSMVIKYDFSLGDYETVDFLNVDGYPPYIIGPKQTGGIKGFKGVYRDIMMGQDINTKTPWLEGVGGLDGPFASVYHPLADSKPDFLMSCVVGDEVIYLFDKYEDGATPAGARKNRFDFTHTTKIKPKARMRSEEEPSLYGEFNDQQLGINLDPLDDAYQVYITDESGKAVYEKTINAGNIVALDIDISAYAKGRYTVTVENSRESFTGEFETQTTGISDAVRLNNKERMINDKLIYNLQGQRLNSLQKGLNIVNGRKIYVK